MLFYIRQDVQGEDYQKFFNTKVKDDKEAIEEEEEEEKKKCSIL